MASLTVNNVSKSYGGTRVLQPIDVSVADGKFLCLLGSSGSGKSTLLRIIAGLAEPDDGSVVIGDRDVTRTPVEKRRVGFVFQNYALFPHLSVGANVSYGLRAKGIKRGEIRPLVHDMLALVGLGDMANRKPAQLSGGQQQRVALARALVTQPDVLLLDEPLSALDRKIRGEMQRELKRIHSETGLTTIMVTHDQEEAMNLGDEVLMLDGGLLQQHGGPLDLYRQPKNAFVASFLGAEPLGEGTVIVENGEKRVIVQGVGFLIADGPAAGLSARAMVMAESVSVGRVESSHGRDTHQGVVRSLDFFGPFARLRVDVGGVEVPSIMLSHNVSQDLEVGHQVTLSIAPGGVHAFAA